MKYVINQIFYPNQFQFFLSFSIGVFTFHFFVYYFSQVYPQLHMFLALVVVFELLFIFLRIYVNTFNKILLLKMTSFFEKRNFNIGYVNKNEIFTLVYLVFPKKSTKKFAQFELRRAAVSTINIFLQRDKREVTQRFFVCHELYSRKNGVEFCLK